MLDRQRLMAPDALPRHILERADVTAACSTHDFATLFALIKRYAGVSQNRIAAALDLSPSRVGEIIHGRRRITSMEVISRVSDRFAIPGRMLGLAPREWETTFPDGVAAPALDTLGERNRASAGDIGGYAELPHLVEIDGGQGRKLVGESRPASGTSGMNYRAGEADIDERVAASHEQWLRTRRLLNLHRTELTQLAARLYPETVRLGRTGILMPPQWRPATAVDLSSIELHWYDAPAPAINGQHLQTRPLRPLAAPGRRYHRYHRAMRDLDRPRLFENRRSHRLLAADWSGDGRSRLELGDMCYFDMIDVGEALAHEITLAATGPNGAIDADRVGWDALPLRRMVRDPFDLTTYPLLLSISTLTLRRGRAGTTFLLLRRSPAKVAVAGGMLSVMPTGVFQPASVLPTPDSPDFDLWRNMMREYSEEFLGSPEHDGDGPPIDYANQEPFRSLDAARRVGKLHVYCLGVGIDALNYVGDVLSVAVFDDDVFDNLFTELVEQNDEGTVVITDDQRREFAFDATTIDRLLTTQPVAPSGAACLRLAWQHREAILAQ